MTVEGPNCLTAGDVAKLKTIGDANRAKAFCPYGHPYSGENLRITAEGARGCRTCLRRQKRESAKRCRKRDPNKPANHAKTHCPHGHPYSGENLVVAPNGSRRCKTCLKERREAGRAVSSATMFLVMEALQSGQTLAQVCGRAKGSERIVQESKLYYFRKAHPPLNKRIRAISARNLKLYREAARGACKQGKSDLFDAQMLAELDRLISKHLAADMRDDVLGNMVLAWREGRFSFDELKAQVGKFISREYQLNHNNWGTLSLDKPISEGGDLTIGHIVTRGMWNDNSEPE